MNRHLIRLLCALALCVRAVPSAGGVVVALSDPAMLDLQPPVITPDSPLAGTALLPETDCAFLWTVDELNFIEADEPIAFEILIDDQSVMLLEMHPDADGAYRVDWTTPADETENCRWRVSAVDSMGSAVTRLVGPVRIASSGVGVEETIPTAVTLAPNYPNPFNPTTRLTFTLPAARRARLTIHDTRGRRVAVLHDGVLPAGTYVFPWRAAGEASGVYFARLETASVTLTRKLLLVK